MGCTISESQSDSEGRKQKVKMRSNNKNIINDKREFKALMDILGAEAFDTTFKVSMELTTRMLAEDCIISMLFDDSRRMTDEEKILMRNIS